MPEQKEIGNAFSNSQVLLKGIGFFELWLTPSDVQTLCRYSMHLEVNWIHEIWKAKLNRHVPLLNNSIIMLI